VVGLVVLCGSRIEIHGRVPERTQDGHAATEVPDAGRDGCAGPGDAAHLGHALRSVGEKPNHELGEHRVELIVLEGQGFRRPDAHIDVGHARAARIDRLRIGVDPDHVLGADQLREWFSERTAATTHIKHALPGTDACGLDQLMREPAAVPADAPFVAIGHRTVASATVAQLAASAAAAASTSLSVVS
jgi:hypothetical protein